MEILGAPSIKAVWIECYNAWVALEGCHRIRAAFDLGLIPEIEEIEYSEDETLTNVGVDHDCGDDCTIADVCSDAYKNQMIHFEE